MWMRFLLVIFALVFVVGGCAAPDSPKFTVPAGQYARTFDIIRDGLRSRRFNLERVDAQAGVITTAAKPTAGLATPWDRDQTTLTQEFEDLMNQHSRRVRITFEPAVGPPDQELDPNVEMVGRVEVVVYRMQLAGLRPPSRSISQTSLALDPAAIEEGVGGGYEVPISQDSQLAARIAAAIQKEVGKASRRTEAEPEVEPQRVARP